MMTASPSTQSVPHLLSMSAPMGSIATAIDPNSDFPTDGAVSSTHPVQYFSIALHEPALVVLRMQEANTASRCVLFLSCTTPKPNTNSASWRLLSPDPVKQLMLHPADPAYRVGVLTIAVHYLEESGCSHFQLRAKLQGDFFAMWLRTGEVPCADAAAVAATGGDAARGTQRGAEASNAISSTLHALLSHSVSRAATTYSSPAAGAAAAAAVAAADTRGALFTSLYVGDWHGNQRDGLGLQYYAAPDEAAVGELGWRDTVRYGDGEASASLTSGYGGTAPSCTSPLTPAGGGGGTATCVGSVTSPLLLLRAFSERHNLPWSAWSVPDTRTPKELATLGLPHSLRLSTSAALRAGRPPLGDDAPSALAPVVSSTSPALPAPVASPVSSPTLPPPPPASPYTTAVGGLSVLDGAIDHLIFNRIRDADLSQWAVLPVQPGVEVYAGEWAANAKDGHGTYQWLDRSYMGEWVAGRREGYGLLRRRDGAWYRGQWERHLPHGLGEACIVPGNLRYNGEWRKGCRSGRGCLTSPDGTAVHGVWVADVLLPEVRTVYADGSVYDGTWGPEGCRDGPGTLTDTAGCRHIHTWRHNSREGDGREVYPNGVVLEGTWQDDACCCAVYVFPNGDRYVGEMDTELHVREGTGTCTSADGLSVYTGGWSKDQRTGHGVFLRHAASGPDPAAAAAPGVVVERYDGEWLADARSGVGHQEDGDHVYDGSFYDDCRNGAGVQRNTRTGSFYNGQWQAGRRCGAGAYYSATNDTTYEGVFLKDRLTGSGTAIKGGSSEQYSGLWVDGAEEGHGSLRLANGDTLRGVWHRGIPEAGTSVEYTDAAEKGTSRDSRYVGGWQDGARHGTGTQVFRDGSVYEGAWVHNRQHGHGRRTAASGESVECEWVDGGIAPGGVAVVYFADGSSYIGPVNAAGLPHGAGVLTYPDGTVFDGQFSDGIYQL